MESVTYQVICLEQEFFCLTRDTFWGKFSRVEKWGRRRFRRPFSLPGTPPDHTRETPRAARPPMWRTRSCMMRPPSLPTRPSWPTPWPVPYLVMPGLVPGIHVLLHRGAGRERTRRWRDVDARNKSGHDGVGEAGSTQRPGTGRHLPTEMPTGRSSRQMSTFPPGICGARMSTRWRFVDSMPMSTAGTNAGPRRHGLGRGFSRARPAADRGAHAVPWRRAGWRRHSSKCSRAGMCRRRRCRAIRGTGSPAGCP